MSVKIHRTHGGTFVVGPSWEEEWQARALRELLAHFRKAFPTRQSCEHHAFGPLADVEAFLREKLAAA